MESLLTMVSCVLAMQLSDHSTNFPLIALGDVLTN